MWFLALMVAGLSWLVLRAVSKPVGHERLYRFVGRVRLGLQPGELLATGEMETLSRYLEVTRRWRTIGLAAALCLTLAEGLRRNGIHLDLYLVLTGWFVGAVFAEWRLSTTPEGERRRASLMPRRQADYLSPAHRMVPWAAALVALAVGSVNIAAGSVARPNVVLMGWVVVVMVTVGAVGRQVLRRPQPFDADHRLRRADDTVRARSLSVLSGSAVALVTTALGGLVDLSLRLDGGIWGGLPAVVIVGGTLAGWLMAVARRWRGAEAAVVVS